jgi:hypothetical protein
MHGAIIAINCSKITTAGENAREHRMARKCTQKPHTASLEPAVEEKTRVLGVVLVCLLSVRNSRAKIFVILTRAV